MTLNARRGSLRSRLLGYAFMLVCLLGSGFSFAHYFTDGFSGQSRQAAIQSGPARRTQLRTRKIRDIRPGVRVLADNPELGGATIPALQVEPKQWRLVTLEMKKPDGSLLSIQLLRDVEWLEQTKAGVGASVELNLVELGAAGPATVLAIAPCPPIEPGNGRIVTGSFRHTAGNVIDLRVSGLDEPIGTTDNHPFWSEDRQAFVPAGELRISEKLRSLSGETTFVLAKSPRGPPEDVFNIEVEGEHVYYITGAGVLVHNSYPLPPGSALPDDEIVVMAGNATKPGSFTIRPQDTMPLPGVTARGKSSTIATDLEKSTEIQQMFGRSAKRSDTISAASARDIRAAGFDVVYAPTSGNTLHARIIEGTSSFDDIDAVELLTLAFDRIK